MEYVQITEVESGTSFQLPVGESLLRGMEKAGAKIINVGCRGGGCGLCKIRILKGEFELKKMSSLHVSDSEKGAGYVLACRCFPTTNIDFELIKIKSEPVNKSV